MSPWPTKEDMQAPELKTGRTLSVVCTSKPPRPTKHLQSCRKYPTLRYPRPRQFLDTMNQSQWSPQNTQTSTGIIGQYPQPSTEPPPDIGGVGMAMSRMNQVIEANTEVVGHLLQRLDSTGVLRPSKPEPSSGASGSHVSPNCSLANTIDSHAMRLQSVNDVLVDLMRRLDL